MLPQGLSNFLCTIIDSFLGPIFAIVIGMSVAPARKKEVGYGLLGLSALITVMVNSSIFANHRPQLFLNIVAFLSTMLALWLFYRRLQLMQPENAYPDSLLYNTTAGLNGMPTYVTGGPTTIAQTLTVKGFDRKGEPKIRIMDNGSIYIAFRALPSQTIFDDFELKLQRTAGVEVLRQNNECFFIPQPAADTVHQLMYYLATFRNVKA